MKIITILLTVFALNSCGSTKSKTNMKEVSDENKTEKLSGKYVITSFNSTEDLPENMHLDFDNENNKVSGFSGCNTFFGNYTIEGNTINFKGLASTKKYCSKVENDIESKMLKAINQTNNFKIKNNSITLLNNKTTLLNAIKARDAKIAQETIKIEYRAHTRGYLNKIVLENKTVSVQESFNVEPTVKPCSDEEWNAIMKLVSEYNLKNLNTLEAPSKAFQYDGAAITNLTVYKNGETYQTPPFDNGKPNQEIASIVEMILKIAKSSKEKN